MTKSNAPDSGPWTPGLTSSIPPHLMPRVTLFDPANSRVDWPTAKALSDLIGLKPQHLIAFHPDRLALHHVLIRVTAELHVPDGPNYADFGLSLREMARVVFDDYVTDDLPRIKANHDALRTNAAQCITENIQNLFTEPAPEPEPSLLTKLFKRPPPAAPSKPRKDRAFEALNRWSAATETDDLARSCHKALARIIGAILSKRGDLLVEQDVIIQAATNLVANDLGDTKIGESVAQAFDKAVQTEGFYRLPPQENPVVLNAKGASASGKSTIRAQQQQIAKTQGIDWQDFAVISPDYWRKHLLDYDSLGDDYKYAAMLTGQELELIDKKLDRLMAQNATAGHVPHMLIDRFRFDSFQPVSERPADSNLLTRFGSRIYMFFMVTPPAETVKRAYARGLSTGRYKAVDDLLYHNIEAYSGMPDLFFAWALAQDRWVHYEFLDNSVALGETPRSIAYGQNGSLVINDVAGMCDIERFRHVNVDANQPEDILQPSSNPQAFLRRCCKLLPRVDFTVPGSTDIYARFENGQVSVVPDLMPDTAPKGLFDGAKISTDLGQITADQRLETIGDL